MISGGVIGLSVCANACHFKYLCIHLCSSLCLVGFGLVTTSVLLLYLPSISASIQSESSSLDHFGFLVAASSSLLLILRLLAKKTTPDVDGVSVSSGKE